MEIQHSDQSRLAMKRMAGVDIRVVPRLGSSMPGQPLVVPLMVVVIDMFPQHPLEVLRRQRDDVPPDLAPHGPDEPLDIGVQVRRPWPLAVVSRGPLREGCDLSVACRWASVACGKSMNPWPTTW
jgi:hypothetical protein